MIEPLIQNKNRYSFPNMKIDNRFHNHYHTFQNKCTYKTLCIHQNKNLYTHQSRECCIREDNSEHIHQSMCRMCNNLIQQVQPQ